MRQPRLVDLLQTLGYLRYEPGTMTILRAQQTPARAPGTSNRVYRGLLNMLQVSRDNHHRHHVLVIVPLRCRQR